MSKRSPEALRTLFGKAVAAHQAGQTAEAEKLYTKVLQADPEQFDTLRLLGHLDLRRGRAESAAKLFTRALRVNPRSPEVLANRGTARLELGVTEQAVDDFSKALELQPDNAGVHSNLGTALARLGRAEEALAAYERALALAPTFAQARYNHGNVLLDLGRYAPALADFDTAIVLNPDYAEAHHNRGICLRALDRIDEALASFDRALTLRPAYPEAVNSKAVLLRGERRYGQAAECFGQLVRMAPHFPYALGAMLDAKLYNCDWSTLKPDLESVRAGLRERKRVTEPFVLLATMDDPEQQLQCARLFVANDIRPARDRLWQGKPYGHERIRIGYVSGDFGEHPVASLMVEVFEKHDRDRFEVIAISLHRRPECELRSRLTRAFDEFVDAEGRSGPDVARVIRDREIDIAVDLMGHTIGNRMDAFGHRPAPVQVNYLGYSGTSGADFMDYIIADRTVIPDTASAHYSERVVRLTDQFFANSARAVTPGTPSRAAHGLPERGFVFCFLSSHYKILPETFALWIRLLGAIEGSVLWLGSFNPEARDNLRLEAGRAGIDPQRLVFAQRVERMEDHLARYRCADLLVDTFPYNAHTTTSDALLAGLPVVTCLGKSFASRIAASLLNAAGLGELVTSTFEEYEALILRLAREPDLIASFRERLVRNHATQPLFDSTRFTRTLEQAYIRMWERAERGEGPAAFDL